MEASVRLEYVAAGGNRHPSAADWAPNLIAFGAGKNVALWNPEDERHNGIFALLHGHTDDVNAVKVYDGPHGRYLITGGADKTIRIWAPSEHEYPPYEQIQCLTEHHASINSIVVLPDSELLATGSADGTVKTWHMSNTGAKLIQSISLKPQYLPLTAALALLADGAVVLAVAGTFSSIQLYVREKAGVVFALQATLTGHEGWIRSLDFTQDVGGDLLLASSSQDKYIRLWRFHQGAISTEVRPANVLTVGKEALSNRSHQVGSSGAKHSVTFEALLIGHEDWIYTARWAPRTSSYKSPTLLTASADNSLSIWSADEGSGVWICGTRLGEISAQKGSTSATGSTGGFWIGMWQPDGRAVVSLGRTGSWRRWRHDWDEDIWLQQVGVSGHTQEVQSLAWATDGSYLLTTSADQTTRLLAEWRRGGQHSWHELARPQIHGYDLNCVESISPNCFISGADEKLLRVFDKPKAIDDLLAKLSGVTPTVEGGVADAANMPVLGLSNKAVTVVADDEQANGVIDGNADEREVVDPKSVVHKSTLDLDHPPLEDHLARHTLWPEHEKLYGHGYEICAVATSHDGTLVATACKASSIDHAVIRLYETASWREIRPSLTAHTLTVTSLSFSEDDKYLLSVGRDRQWAVFERDVEATDQFKPFASNSKGHARMILDCSWASGASKHVFATAGRDKSVKIWSISDSNAECITTIPATSSVTAVAFAPKGSADGILLAYGTEDGCIQLERLQQTTLQAETSTALPKALCPSGAVTRLQWRPRTSDDDDNLLAAASEDGSIQMLTVK